MKRQEVLDKVSEIKQRRKNAEMKNAEMKSLVEKLSKDPNYKSFPGTSMYVELFGRVYLTLT